MPQDSTSLIRPLRWWPVPFLLAGMVVLHFLPKWWLDGPTLMWMSPAFGPAICALLIVVWWLWGSRATRRERWFGLLGLVCFLTLTLFLVDRSMIGAAITMQTLPYGLAAFGIAAMLGARWLSLRRTVVAVALGALGFGYSLLWRNDGMWGNFDQAYSFRWQPSAEEELLAKVSDPKQAQTISESWLQGLAAPEWPEFRGAGRTGVVTNSAAITTDWETSPPELLWKIPVGPGWSSFAVAGELLFTQEQRGPLETVVCYHTESGAELWTHSVESRFDEPLGGPGPRATPTLADGSLFVMGAQGWLTRLDPKTGDLLWGKDLREVANRKPPMWGFASSPLVMGSLVIVHASGDGELGLLAFDSTSGELRWSAATGTQSYSSPQPYVIDGQMVVGMSTDLGLDLFDLVSGKALLRYEWKHNGYRCVQPQMIDQSSLLIPTGLGGGTRRIRLNKSTEGGWTAEEVWTSRRLKPDFNDLVLFQGHAYGFDDSIFTCISLETGERAWKKGRYGKGQVVLLKESGLLVIASERGEVVLVKADPSGHHELARFQALEGKTWNHPTVVGDRLYLRNGEEAACYRLPVSQ